MKLGILSPTSSPHKETARVSVVTEKPMKATVKLSTVPPTEIPPAGIVRPPPIKVAAPPLAGLVELVPMAFYWALLGISALAFLIQLWTYLS
ncbi:MAG TPA: hypothetical protein VHW03_05205 [Chthoniobacterales bacterium]|jgi:hypothetical protein|nr:hypothetical protein [Chthoniobacterales bacterium]